MLLIGRKDLCNERQQNLQRKHLQCYTYRAPLRQAINLFSKDSESSIQTVWPIRLFFLETQILSDFGAFQKGSWQCKGNRPDICFGQEKLAHILSFSENPIKWPHSLC